MREEAEPCRVEMLLWLKDSTAEIFYSCLYMFNSIGSMTFDLQVKCFRCCFLMFFGSIWILFTITNQSNADPSAAR